MVTIVSTVVTVTSGTDQQKLTSIEVQKYDTGYSADNPGGGICRTLERTCTCTGALDSVRCCTGKLYSWENIMFTECRSCSVK